MSAYLKQLKRELAEHQGGHPNPLHKLRTWYDDQPEISRRRPYGMLEIENATGIPGRVLGTLLIKLGWTRHRRWANTTSYRRYWLPPGLTEKNSRG